MCLILPCAGCLLYLSHVERQGQQELARTAESVSRLNARYSDSISAATADTQPPATEDTESKTSVPSVPDFKASLELDGLTRDEKQGDLAAKLAEATEIEVALRAKLEALEAEKERRDTARANLSILNAYNEWLNAYNAEGAELDAFAAAYNQNPSPTEADEQYADYVRRRQAERPIEFLTRTNELPLPYREQLILKYHANLVRDLGLKEANKIFIIN